MNERKRFKRIILNPCSRAGFTFENVNYLNKYCNYYSYLFFINNFLKNAKRTQKKRKKRIWNKFAFFALLRKKAKAKRCRFASHRFLVQGVRFASLSLFVSKKISPSLRFRNRFLVRIGHLGWSNGKFKPYSALHVPLKINKKYQ